MERVNLIQRRCCRPFYIPKLLLLAMAPFWIPLLAVGLVAAGIQALVRLWGELWRETWMASRAWRELRALDRFVRAHASRELVHAATNQWAWTDDATRYVLTWRASNQWAEPSVLELVAQGPVPLMTLRLYQHDQPLLLAESDDRDRLEQWARDTAEPIVKHVAELTGELPRVRAELYTARVLAPMVGPLKPLVGALELLLTAVPQKRRAA